MSEPRISAFREAVNSPEQQYTEAWEELAASLTDTYDDRTILSDGGLEYILDRVTDAIRELRAARLRLYGRETSEM